MKKLVTLVVLIGIVLVQGCGESMILVPGNAESPATWQDGYCTRTEHTVIVPEKDNIQTETTIPKETTIPTETTILMQAKRLVLINKLISEGIFHRMDPAFYDYGNPRAMQDVIPCLWVGPKFMILDFKTKSGFVEVVYAYFFDRPGRKQNGLLKDTIIIKNMYTGNRIGSFNLYNLDNPLKLN